MAKVIDTVYMGGILVVAVSDGHFYGAKKGEPERRYFDDIDCPVCAEVKAARAEELDGLLNKWPVNNICTEYTAFKAMLVGRIVTLEKSKQEA